MNDGFFAIALVCTLVLALMYFVRAVSDSIYMNRRNREQERAEQAADDMTRRQHAHGLYCYDYVCHYGEPIQRGKRSYWIAGYFPDNDTHGDRF